MRTVTTNQCITAVTIRVVTTLSLCHKMDTTMVTKLHTRTTQMSTDMGTTQ